MPQSVLEPIRPTSPAALALVLMLGVYAAVLCPRFAAAAHGLTPDSFGLWSFGRFVSRNPPASIYDPQAVLAFQQTLGLSSSGYYPFGYPPAFLLILAPLARLPYRLMATLWEFGSLAACLLAVFAGRRRSAGGIALLLLAPSTVIGLVYGQTGCFIAAVLIGGMRLSARRPWLGGAVLGLLICKPQLALLVPVALVASGRVRALGAAAASALALLAGAGLAFGPELCLAWPRAMLAYAGLLRAGTVPHWPLMPTLTVAALQAGLPDRLALIVQACGGAVAAALTWRSFSARHPSAVAILAAASFLATPYAFVYDLPLLTAGMLTALPAAPLSLPPERLIAPVIALCCPMLMFANLPLGLLTVLAALFVARQGTWPADRPTRGVPILDAAGTAFRAG